jgi:hypothetical protein
LKTQFSIKLGSSSQDFYFGKYGKNARDIYSNIKSMEKKTHGNPFSQTFENRSRPSRSLKKPSIPNE